MKKAERRVIVIEFNEERRNDKRIVKSLLRKNGKEWKEIIRICWEEREINKTPVKGGIAQVIGDWMSVKREWKVNKGKERCFNLKTRCLLVVRTRARLEERERNVI